MASISVITPSFRQLDWLRLCVASVADQAAGDGSDPGHRLSIEHIVQDGGSGEELAEWGGRQSSISFFQEPDSGMYDAVNRGLARASGEICAYLNCDEQYLPGTLARVSTIFRENPEIEVLCADVIVVNSSGSPLAYRRVVEPRRLDRWYVLNTFTAATFFRRSLFQEGHVFPAEYRSIGDLVWMEKLLRAQRKVVCIPELLSSFTLAATNLSQMDGAVSEQRKWLGGEAFAGALKAAARLSLLARKTVHGAYRPRSFDYKIYTLQSPAKRVRFSAAGLGGIWKRPS